MSEWDTGSPGFEEPAPSSGKKEGVGTGGLHGPMSIACLIVVTAVSFGIAWLMKDKVRTFPEMGLTFAAPFAALMFSAILTEKYTGGMVPACSRKAQLMFASGTIAAAFIFGCLAEVLHQPVVVENREPQYDYIIIEDKSASMLNDLEEPCREAMHALIDRAEGENGMADENRVGFIAFGSDTVNEATGERLNAIVGKAEIRKLDKKQRQDIGKIIDKEIPTWPYLNGWQGPGTDFRAAMDEAMRMIDGLEDSNRPIRIILVTDGCLDDPIDLRDFDSFNAWAEKRNRDSRLQKAELCAVQLGKPMLDMVRNAVNLTGGEVFDTTDPAALAQKLGTLEKTVIVPERVDTLKATYDGKTADGKPNTAYVILTAVLLLLLGLLCGISLRIMFSLRGQFRFQMILSPLMGLAAFALLNWGKALGIEPPWVCEGIAFSLFGLVFMRKNGSIGRSAALPKAAPAGSPAEGWSEDF